MRILAPNMIADVTVRCIVLTIVALSAAACALTVGCAGTEGPYTLRAPGAPFGAIEHSDEIRDYCMVLRWTEGGALAVGYNVYRKIGTSPFQELNSALIRPTPLGDGAEAPETLVYADTAFDKSSTYEHVYYVTSVDEGGLESPPSDVVVCVPAAIDLEALVAGLTPDASYGVGLVPILNWAPIPRALSYCIVVMSVGPGDVESIKWMHRVGLPPAKYKRLSGTTYVDVGGDTLAKDTDYRWCVMALDGQNCAFASGEGTFSTKPGDGL